MSDNFPVIGDAYYYMQNKVSVLNVWDYFYLVEVEDLTNQNVFYVDSCSLTNEPDISSSLSLRLFYGGIK